MWQGDAHHPRPFGCGPRACTELAEVATANQRRVEQPDHELTVRILCYGVTSQQGAR